MEGDAHEALQTAEEVYQVVIEDMQKYIEGLAVNETVDPPT